MPKEMFVCRASQGNFAVSVRFLRESESGRFTAPAASINRVIVAAFNAIPAEMMANPDSCVTFARQLYQRLDVRKIEDKSGTILAVEVIDGRFNHGFIIEADQPA